MKVTAGLGLGGQISRGLERLIHGTNERSYVEHAKNGKSKRFWQLMFLLSTLEIALAAAILSKQRNFKYEYYRWWSQWLSRRARL